jgi:hypothetical protein
MVLCGLVPGERTADCAKRMSGVGLPTWIRISSGIHPVVAVALALNIRGTALVAEGRPRRALAFPAGYDGRWRSEIHGMVRLGKG